MDVFAIGEPQLVHAARVRAGAIEKGNRPRILRHRDVEQFKTRGLEALLLRLVGNCHDVADGLQRVRSHMRLRQIGPRDDLRRARIADIDGSEILRGALMGEPQDPAPISSYLDRHALADPAEAVELVMRKLPKIPNRRVGHA